MWVRRQVIPRRQVGGDQRAAGAMSGVPVLWSWAACARVGVGNGSVHPSFGVAVTPSRVPGSVALLVHGRGLHGMACSSGLTACPPCAALQPQRLRVAHVCCGTTRGPTCSRSGHVAPGCSRAFTARHHLRPDSGNELEHYQTYARAHTHTHNLLGSVLSCPRNCVVTHL